MKGGKLPRGYTIVEVMIVLAVSGVMFLMAANFISGKQSKTSFQLGSNELSSRIQAIIEEVTDGHYSDIPLTCSADSVKLTLAATASVKQGANPYCVFLGKLVHFSAGGAPNKYEVFSIISARTGTDLVTPINDLGATGNSRLRAAYQPGVVDLTKQATVPQNLEVRTGKMTVTDTNNAPHTVYNIGFIQGLGAIDNVSGYKSGAQTLSMVYVPTISADNMNIAAAAVEIKAGNIQAATKATICVTDGKRSANINLGGTNSSQLNVEVKQLGEVPCP